MELLPDFMNNPIGSAWLYRELDRELTALVAVVRAYIEQAETAAAYDRHHPAPQDPDTWRAERPLIETKQPDTFRPIPKPRDPRRGGKRGDNE
ncbi:hypothetical protein [Amycolatopsis sp. lyj-108]|uniref:hypothetical protein n=1 Tax=Amycolatopsis sp. lyj-108 TaxID=2789286 RepID=UPI0039787FC7